MNENTGGRAFGTEVEVQTGTEFEKSINCWEYMQCGREPGGARSGALGVCQASTDGRLDGVHGGKNAGRACWAIAGVFGKGRIADTFAKRDKDCVSCKFFELVKNEEGKYTWPVVLLHKILQ